VATERPHPSPIQPIATTNIVFPDTTPTPGLIIDGIVRWEDGSGISDVVICRRFASYPGVLAASTNAHGYFESDFIFIPGDEMITVWPIHSGISFQPEYSYWRHYYGTRRTTINFVGFLATDVETNVLDCRE
jgi:hypothetical protein